MVLHGFQGPQRLVPSPAAAIGRTAPPGPSPVSCRDCGSAPPAGAGTKLPVGVRVGLGLLVMRDIACASARSTASASSILSSQAAFGRQGSAGSNPEGIDMDAVRGLRANPREERSGMITTVARIRGGFALVPSIKSRGVLASARTERSSSYTFHGNSRSARKRSLATPFRRSAVRMMTQQGTREAQHTQHQQQQQGQNIPQASTAPARVPSPPASRPNGSPTPTIEPAQGSEGTSTTGTIRANNGALGGEAGGEPRRLGVVARAKASGAPRVTEKRSPPTATLKARVKQMYLKARSYLAQQPPVFESALEILENAVELDERDGHSWLLLARTYERTGNVPAARNVFEQATAILPNNAHLWQGWGMLEDKFGELETARKLFANGLKADPRNPWVCHAWGLMEERDGQIDRARRIYKASRPKVVLTQALGRLEASQGNLEEARRIFEEGLERLNKSPWPESKWVGPGRSSSDWENTREGVDDILLTWAKVEEEFAGDPDRARELIERVEAGDPHNAKVHVDRARLEIRTGNYKVAREILSKAAGLPHKEGHVYNMWATLELKEGNVETALKITQAAAERYPGDRTILQTLGTVYGKLGQPAKAIGCYRRSIAIRPNAPAFVAWALLISGLAGRQEEDTLKHDTEALTKGEERDDPDCDDEDDDVSGSLGGRLGSGGGDDVPLLSKGGKTAGRRVSSMGFDGYPAGPFEMEDDSHEGEGGQAAYGKDYDEGDLAGITVSYNEARRLFEEGIKVEPSHGILYNAYGLMESQLGNVENARRVFQRAIDARCTDMPSVWNGLGRLEASAGDPDRARETLWRGIRESPGDVSFVYHSLGSLEMAANRPNDALEVFLEGVGRYSKHTQLLLGAALALTQMERVDEAREYFKLSVQSDAKHAHSWQAWGLMEARAHNYEVARSLWESGLKHNPLHGPLWQVYAVMEDGLGEKDRARTLFAAGIERCPDHVQLHQAWAVMERQEGNLDVAGKLVEHALKVDPRHGALWTVYGQVEFLKGYHMRSRKAFQLGARICSDHAPLYRSWGLMEYRAGFPAEAIHVFDEGLMASPTYIGLYYSCANVLASEGDIESVMELRDRGLRVMENDPTVSVADREEFVERMGIIATAGRFDPQQHQERDDYDVDVFDVP